MLDILPVVLDDTFRDVWYDILRDGFCVTFCRFAAAAIAAFGAISLDNRVEKVPVEMKKKFKEVANEKALVLHDNLEVRDRYDTFDIEKHEPATASPSC